MNHYLGEPIMISEYYPVFLFIYLKVILAQILVLRSFMRRRIGSFLTLIPLLARLIILSILLILSKKLVAIRVNSWFNQNMKTKPFQSQTKPFFPRSNFDFSPKMRIFDKFRQTFLCKTKPFFSKIQIKNKGVTAVSKSSARPALSAVERAL